MSVGTILITGGQGGLGTAIANLWHNAGWQVLAPSHEKLDVANPSSITSYFSNLSELDVLILNAGTLADAPFAYLTEQDWDLILTTNLDGAFRCIRSALPLLHKGHDAHIIAISSHTALTGRLGQSNYAASKAALIALMKSLARELGPAGIRCNAVLPGFLNTKMTAHLSHNARLAIHTQHALPARNTPTDIAHFLLALQALPGVSGQHFSLDSRITSWT